MKAFTTRRKYLFPHDLTLEKTVRLKTGEYPRCQFWNNGRQCRYRAKENSLYCGQHRWCVYLTTREAAEILRIPPRKAREVLGEPDDVRKLDGGRKQYLWRPERVLTLINDPRVTGYKTRNTKDYAATFNDKYDDLQAAIEDAAEALFNLNRYAKHAKCAERHRKRIYELKTRFIRLLYRRGYCIAAAEHVVVRPPRKCRGCDGWGCERCNFTGEFKPRPLEYVMFQFEINGRRYAWHQPHERVNWPFRCTTEDDGGWTPEFEKPLNMSTNRFAEGKALIEWVCDRMQDES